MVHQLLTQMINDIQPILQENVMIYFLLSVLYYLVGGVDESFMTLVMLHLVLIITCLLCKKSINLDSILRVYITIILGNIVDGIINLGNTSLRIYLIIYYTYNTMVDIVNTLSEDKRFPIPEKLRKILEKMKKE